MYSLTFPISAGSFMRSSTSKTREPKRVSVAHEISKSEKSNFKRVRAKKEREGRERERERRGEGEKENQAIAVSIREGRGRCEGERM